MKLRGKRAFFVASTWLIAAPVSAAPLESDGHIASYTMADIAPGSFLMGIPASGFLFPRHTDPHQVELTQPYAIGVDEVNQDLWAELMGSKPWRPLVNRCFLEQQPDDTLAPATCITWYEVAEFCNRLSELSGLEPAYEIQKRTVQWNREANGYRLPTEAEWEYAARGGNQDPHTGHFNASEARNYRGNVYQGRVDLAAAEPNMWGLNHMVAGPGEWVWDYYDKDLKPAYNPQGANWHRWRVVKGEGWSTATPPVRAAARSGERPWLADIRLGFRLAKTLPIARSETR